MRRKQRAFGNAAKRWGSDVATRRSDLAVSIKRNRKTHRKQGYRVKGFASSVTGMGYLQFGGKGFGRGSSYATWRNKRTGTPKTRRRKR